MKKWQPVDIIVLLLTSVVWVFLVIGAIKSFVPDAEVSDEKAKLYAATLASLISIISMYIGAKIQKARDEKILGKTSS